MVTYYTLLVRDTDTGVWSPQFGDYSRAVVVDERKEYHERDEVSYKDMKILCTLDDQEAINAGIATFQQQYDEIDNRG